MRKMEEFKEEKEGDTQSLYAKQNKKQSWQNWVRERGRDME